ncbi:collagen alpha-4(VI) chain isoform X2 [Patella vulgata]|uniref:collagen alpha-4(VI) chain isoform X2 n=1 Tax=Patella vulgata TaxID=6465 RepID=UPI00217F8721|nr:collagen alpha-4(VI) chain isoform X2 [Patella vulgata]
MDLSTALGVVIMVVSVTGTTDDKVCGGKPAEIFFLLDSSSSVWREDYNRQKQFVADVVDKFVISENHTRVGLAVFSNTYRLWFPIDRYLDKESMKRAVMQLPYLTGDTNTHIALKYMRERGFKPSLVRKDVARIGIILTDGKSRYTDKTLLEAQRCKNDGIVLFTIGIGDKIDMKELNAVGTNPSYVFQVAGFDVLYEIRQKLAFKACAVEAPQKDEPSCGKMKKADVIFLYDSGTLGSTQVAQINLFIEDVVPHFNMASGNIRTGILTTNCYRGDFNLDQYRDKTEFIKQLRNLEIPDLSSVVRRLRLHSYNPENGGRPDVRKMAVIFLDDKLRVPKKVMSEVSRAKFGGIEIFVVTVGDKYDPREVEDICTPPMNNHMINFKSYNSLADVKNVTRPNFINMFCNDLVDPQL